MKAQMGMGSIMPFWWLLMKMAGVPGLGNASNPSRPRMRKYRVMPLQTSTWVSL